MDLAWQCHYLGKLNIWAKHIRIWLLWTSTWTWTWLQLKMWTKTKTIWWIVFTIHSLCMCAIALRFLIFVLLLLIFSIWLWKILRIVWFVGMKIYSRPNMSIHIGTQCVKVNQTFMRRWRKQYAFHFAIWLLSLSHSRTLSRSVCCWLRLWLNASSWYCCASYEAHFATSCVETGCHCYWKFRIYSTNHVKHFSGKHTFFKVKNWN